MFGRFVDRLVLGAGGKIFDRSCIVHSNGTDRLRLRFVKDALRWRASKRQTGKSGLNFHSLVWERRSGGTWRRHRSVSPHRVNAKSYLWVSDVHSFDPDKGSAIIKVARETGYANLSAALRAGIEKQLAGRAVEHHAVEYCWVEWDLRQNRDVRLLQTCTLPTEPYGGWQNGQPEGRLSPP